MNDKRDSNVLIGQKYSGIQGLIEIVKKLRSETGCPWDRKQTAETLKPYVVEEAYEVVDAISLDDKVEIVEELGDLLLQVIFLSQIYSEQGEFSMDDVILAISKKMLRRHPHVFDENFSLKEGECLDDAILRNWEIIKAEEKKEKLKKSGKISETINPSVYVSESMPALHRAYMIQEKAKRIGFDFDSADEAIDKIYEEISELKNEMDKIKNNKDAGMEENILNRIKEEYGDVLFSAVNIGRLTNIHPCAALNESSNKFIKRFGYMENKAAENECGISDLDASRLDELWEESKRKLS